MIESQQFARMAFSILLSRKQEAIVKYLGEEMMAPSLQKKRQGKSTKRDSFLSRTIEQLALSHDLVDKRLFEILNEMLPGHPAAAIPAG